MKMTGGLGPHLEDLVRIGSVALYRAGDGQLAWQAVVIDAGRPPDIGPWRCGHEHPLPGDAWPCAEAELFRREAASTGMHPNP